MSEPTQVLSVEPLQSRLKDPFIGSLVIAFAVLHWRFFYELAYPFGPSLRADERMMMASAVFDIFGPRLDLLVVFVAAVFYTFAWPYISGWIRTALARIELVETNRIRSVEARNKLETAVSLLQRPEFLESRQSFEKLWDVMLQALMNALKAASIQSPHWELGKLAQPMDSAFFPRLLSRDDKGMLHPYVRPELVVDAPSRAAVPQRTVLAFVWLSPTQVLYVQTGGCVPWAWPDATFCTFEKDRPVSLVAELPTRTSDWPVPRIEKATGDFGRFITVNVL